MLLLEQSRFKSLHTVIQNGAGVNDSKYISPKAREMGNLNGTGILGDLDGSPVVFFLLLLLLFFFTITSKLLCHLLPNYTDSRLKRYLKTPLYFKKKYFCFVHMYVCHVYSWECIGSKWVVDALELEWELLVDVRHQTYMLGTEHGYPGRPELRFSGRGVSTY